MKRVDVVDFGPDPLARHKPGQRLAFDADVRDASERAYREMVEQATNAWRGPQRVAEDTERACVIARDEVAIADAEQRRFSAWREMVEEAVNAWKARP